jgi:hypothetical protein
MLKNERLTKDFIEVKLSNEIVMKQLGQLGNDLNTLNTQRCLCLSSVKINGAIPGDINGVYDPTIFVVVRTLAF